MAANIPYSIATNAEQFLLGMATEQIARYNDETKLADKVESVIKSIESDLRNVYDSYIPNVHVVNVDSFTSLVANALLNTKLENVDKQYISKLSDNSSKEYKSLHTLIKNKVSDYHNKLLGTQGGTTNPILELNNLSLKLFNRTRNIDNPVVARYLGNEFAKRIRIVFGNKAVLAAIDQNLGSSNTVYVFFSSSFTAITDAFRTQVYKAIEPELLKALNTDTKKLNLGSLVNLGHAALVNDLGVYLNSPAFARVLFNTAKNRAALFKSSEISEAASFFKRESGLIENKIEVSKEFTDPRTGYGVLLSLGVTFTNFEDAVINQTRGRTTEAAAVRAFKIVKNKPLTRSEKVALTKLLLNKVFKNRPALGKSSSNMLEFIESAYTSVLLGKPIKSEKKKTTVSKKATVTRVTRVNKKSSKFATPVVATASKVQLQKAKAEDFYSLALLQQLLDSLLVTKIKENMGDGSRKDILNLRSGRFAESVRVERLSESRQGMITAFYSYMKNPYQTFEPGYRQGSPASRDPKLLISKSIREIAATRVANRLRAVRI